MAEPSPHPEHAPESDQPQLVLVVTGAHLRAEIGDRPLAYRFKQRIEAWQKRHADRLSVRIQPVVCSDLWYLNNEALQRLPTISVGGPGVNALSALFAKQLPEEEATEDADADAVDVSSDQPKVVIQIDPDFTDLRACVWGTNQELTEAGVRVFTRRYLSGFLKAVATQIEPRE